MLALDLGEPARLMGIVPAATVEAGFLHHGLSISLTSVQPGHFESDLDLPLSLVERYHLPAQTVGYVKARTTPPQQTLRLTVHALRGVPTFLTHLGSLRLQQVTGPIDAVGASHTDTFKSTPEGSSALSTGRASVVGPRPQSVENHATPGFPTNVVVIACDLQDST